MPASQTIIVLGPPRSGTSMTAGLLARLGVDMGNIRKPDAENPTGYYEDSDYLKLVDSIFNKAASGANGFSPPTSEEIATVIYEYTDEIASLIKNKILNSNSDFYGWKATGTSLMMEHFARHVTNPYFVVVLRNPLDVSSSMMRYTKTKNQYDPIDREEALSLTFHYYQEIMRFVSFNRPRNVFYLSYDAMISDTDTQLGNLVGFLGYEPMPAQLETCKAFLNSRESMQAKKMAFKIRQKALSLPARIKNKIKRALVSPNRPVQ